MASSVALTPSTIVPEVALVPGRVGAGRELTLHRGRGERAGVLDQRVDRVDAGVEVVLQRIEVAVVALGDLRGDRSLGDPVHIVGGHVERDDDRVQGRVHALDDGAEVALVPGRVGARRELAFDRRVRERLRVGDQQIHRVDAGVEVVFEGVEVAVVAVRDLGRDRPLGDPVHVVGGHVERTDDGVERGVDAFDDAAEVAAVLGGVGAGRELAFDRRARERLRIGDQQVHRIDAGVEVVLDDVEIAAIRLDDLLGNLALGDALDIARRDIERRDHRIEQLVHAPDHPGIGALEPARVAARVQPPLLGRADQHAGLGHDLLQLALHRAEGVGELAHLVFLANGDLPVELAPGELLGRAGHRHDGTGDGFGQ